MHDDTSYPMTNGPDGPATAGPVLVWEKPGPGGWAWDGGHSPRPATPIFQELLPAVTADGFKDFTTRYGAAISHLDTRFVNGYAYATVRIANVPEKDGPAPPAALLKVITRVDPRWRRLERNAKTALADQIWRADLATWEARTRPAEHELLASLQATDVEGMDDAALRAHFVATIAAAHRVLRTHFSLIGSYALPIGQFLMLLDQHGISAADGAAALGGAASGTTLPSRALEGIAAALPSGSTPASLDEIRTISPEAERALDAYLDEYGWRIVGGLDLDQPCQIELPDAILESLDALRLGSDRADSARTSTDDATSRIRDRIPAHLQPEFDTLLTEARRVYGTRDDHAGLGLWAAGLVRRALLTAGAHLAGDGRIPSASDIFFLDIAEVEAALSTTAASTIDFASRAKHKAAATAARPPATLGSASAPPPDGTLPPTIERVSAAIRAVAMLMGRPEDALGLAGLGIGSATYRGRARVAVDALEAMTLVEPGDVLVTAMTTPAFNASLAIVGGLITSEGGPFSHAAIIAREFGIPAVIGAPDAMDAIGDGDVIEVDPLAGTVTIVAPAGRTVTREDAPTA